MMKDTDRVEWPPVTYERRPWDQPADIPLSRRQRLAHRGPYGAAVAPKIAATELHLPNAITALAEDAPDFGIPVADEEGEGGEEEARADDRRQALSAVG